MVGKRSSFGRLLIVLSALMLAGCWSKDVVIESQPMGAEVMLDGELQGPTPVTVSLWQGGLLMPWQTVYQLELKAPGHRPYNKTISLMGQYWVEGELGQWPEKMEIILEENKR